MDELRSHPAVARLGTVTEIRPVLETLTGANPSVTPDNPNGCIDQERGPSLLAQQPGGPADQKIPFRLDGAWPGPGTAEVVLSQVTANRSGVHPDRRRPSGHGREDRSRRRCRGGGPANGGGDQQYGRVEPDADRPCSSTARGISVGDGHCAARLRGGQRGPIRRGSWPACAVSGSGAQKCFALPWPRRPSGRPWPVGRALASGYWWGALCGRHTHVTSTSSLNRSRPGPGSALGSPPCWPSSRSPPPHQACSLLADPLLSTSVRNEAGRGQPVLPPPVLGP